MKTVTIRQFAAVKRVAQNVNPLVTKKAKIEAKIIELLNDKDQLEQEIEGHEIGIKALTGGYTSEQLVVKKVETTDKVDKNGNPIKIVKYEFNPNRVFFDKENNVYVIKEEESVKEETDNLNTCENGNCNLSSSNEEQLNTELPFDI